MDFNSFLNDINHFINPKNIAIIGASRKEGSPGFNILNNLIQSGKGDVIYPVNPNTEEILGIKAYPSVSKIPERIELALIVVPAKLVFDAIKQCGEASVKAALVFSGGFSEMGKEGAKLQEEIAHFAATNKIRVIGPNTLGSYDTSSGLNLTLSETLLKMRPLLKPGNIALISQSGGFGLAFFVYAVEREGVHFSKFIGLGNKCDLDDSDVLEFLETDPLTKVIMMYIEDIKRGKHFLNIASRVTKTKPIVVTKIGMSPAGARAAASHTGALTGEDEVYNAAFKKCGIIRAKSSKTMLDIARALASQPLLRGNNIGIITNSGGISAEVADACQEVGLDVPELSEETQKKLSEILPPYCIRRNPIDLTAPDPKTGEWYLKTTKILLGSEEIDGLIIIMVGLGLPFAGPVIASERDTLFSFNKPILVLGIAREEEMKQVRLALESASIPMYYEAQSISRSMGALFEYAKYLGQGME